MKNVVNVNKPFEYNDETYKNRFVNPVIMNQLQQISQAVEEISIIRVVLNCFDHLNTYIGVLTVVYGIQYTDTYVMAYDVGYDSNEMADPGINATAFCVVDSVYDARNDKEAAEIGALEFKPVMQQYWDTVKARSIS